MCIEAVFLSKLERFREPLNVQLKPEFGQVAAGHQDPRIKALAEYAGKTVRCAGFVAEGSAPVVVGIEILASKKSDPVLVPVNIKWVTGLDLMLEKSGSGQHGSPRSTRKLKGVEKGRSAAD